MNPYYWTPVYVPPSSPPKLYKLIRNIQMHKLDKESSTQRKEESEEETIENDVFTIIDESDQVKVYNKYYILK